MRRLFWCFVLIASIIAPPARAAEPVDLLLVLASERGRVMTRDQLQQRVWGVPHRARDRSVDVCVRKLREKLDNRSPDHEYLHTHYGVGYRLTDV